MAIFEQLVQRLIRWVLGLLGWDLTSSDLVGLQVEDRFLSQLSAFVQILSRKRAAVRLDEVLTGLAQNEDTTVDLLKLYRMVGPPSLSWFVEQLHASPSGNTSVNTSFRVTSPDHPTVYKDYSSFGEVPALIHDAASGISFSPDFNRIRVVVTVWAQGSRYASY